MCAGSTEIFYIKVRISGVNSLMVRSTYKNFLLQSLALYSTQKAW